MTVTPSPSPSSSSAQQGAAAYVDIGLGGGGALPGEAVPLGGNQTNLDLSGDWSAYWGRNRPSGGGEDARDRRRGERYEGYKSASDMQVWLQENWNRSAKFRTIMNQYAVAIPGFGVGYRSVSAMWDAAGAYSAQLAATGKAKLTPMQVLQLWAGGKATGLPNSPIGGDGSGRTTSHSTNTSYDLSDPMTAKALTNAVLSSALGREATAEELSQYRAALNSYEKSNPTVTTGTQTTDANGNSTSSSTSRGGASQAGREQILKDKAMGTAEGQAFTGASMFEKAMQVLASKVG